LATDFTSSKRQVINDLTSVVYKNYMRGEWGIEVGYNTVPDWFAYMRRGQLEWLEEQDCSDSLNTIAINQLLPTICPLCFSLKVTNSGAVFCYRPPNACGLGLAAAETLPTALVVLTTTPIAGINPFPSINCGNSNRCGQQRFNLTPTALFVEFYSNPYGTC
jgi:hypothetical protein